MCSNAGALVGHVRVPALHHMQLPFLHRMGYQVHGCALMRELLFGHVSVLLTLVL